MDLDEIGLAHGTDKASNGHDYLRVYQSLIPADVPVKLLEIGWYEGASMRMWREYLDPGSIVVGVDIEKPAAPVDRVHFRQVDATSRDMVRVAAEFGEFDVIVDDGSHLSPDVIATFRMMWPHVAPGGLYVIEDLHVSYHPDWKGWDPTQPTRGHRYGKTAMGFLQELTDDVHYRHAGAGPANRRMKGDRVGSIAFYPGLAVLRKAGG